MVISPPPGTARNREATGGYEHFLGSVKDLETELFNKGFFQGETAAARQLDLKGQTSHNNPEIISIRGLMAGPVKGVSHIHS